MSLKQTRVERKPKARGANRYSMESVHYSTVRAYTIPTDAPEADGTFAWSSTTIVIVEISAGGKTGLGFTYADATTAQLAKTLLHEVVEGSDVHGHAALWLRLRQQVRNLGDRGIAAMAISAIDNALWDLRAKLHGVSLVQLLGSARDGVPVYGSGGFTTYSDLQLETQLGDWARSGLKFVKMKIGTDAARDPHRVSVARKAIGDDTSLFADANGAYSVKQALELAGLFHDEGVTWFEEPVSSDDLPGLRFIRERAPVGMDIAAGEYGYTSPYFLNMLNAGAVDVLQADATRAHGITGFLEAGAICAAQQRRLSSHCAPSQHLHPCCAVNSVCHMEFFHDHVRIERMFFDGFREPVNGVMCPDWSRPGIGLELKRADAEKFAI